MALTNRFSKIGVGWAVCIAAGVYGFYLSKESVVKKRYQQMKEREQQRILNASASSSNITSK